jgi:hypothetical protein
MWRVLAETRWNRRQAATQLKISYKALLNKLKKWEALPIDSIGPGDDEEPARLRRSAAEAKAAAGLSS